MELRDLVINPLALAGLVGGPLVLHKLTSWNLWICIIIGAPTGVLAGIVLGLIVSSLLGLIFNTLMGLLVSDKPDDGDEN